MTLRSFPRRAALLGAGLLALALAGCGSGDDAPTSFAPLSYDYLPQLRLNVSSIDIDDSWSPPPGTRDVGYLAPTSPVQALRQMAHDRLAAGGPPGRAVFVIDDASLVQNRDRYEGRMVVHLDVTTADGTRSGYAEARVSRTATIGKDTPNAQRAELADLVSKMMDDMNVEFEYQVRRSLRPYLQSADSPSGGSPIQSESLGAPGATPARPTAPQPVIPGSAAPGPTPLAPAPLSPPPQPLMPRGLTPLGPTQG